MREGGTLYKQGSKWQVKDGKNYPLDESIVIPSADFHEAPVETYELDFSGKVVKKLTVLDLEDNPVTFRSKAKDKNETPPKAGGKGAFVRPEGKNEQSQQDKAKHDDRHERENNERYEMPAFAPYNFVPLSDSILVSPPLVRNCSGHLDVMITARTPFFIGNENPSQLDPRNRNQAKPFFQMLDGLMVPGSALRGLARSMVEIVTWSALPDEFFSNKTLSYRAVAERVGRQRDAYRLVIPANREESDIKAGYLKYDKVSKEYYILVASHVDRFGSKEDARDPEWDGGKCFVRSGKMPDSPRTGKGGKKRQWIISAASASKKLPVPASVYKIYRDDATRAKKFDVFKAAKAARGEVSKYGYPVFFNTDSSGEVVLSIGHTAFYRIPYSKTIGNHIEQHPINEGDDFAHSIFGTTKRAGRVWFEDCRPVPDTVRLHPAVFTQLLMGPKPTSFQHYLCQPQGILTPMEELVHWGDENVSIRGHKLFWHRIAPVGGEYGWGAERAAEGQARGTDQAKIQPLQPGAQFRGRIRFDQLTAEELGALLFALDLPEGMAHKLGFAKPLGFGSIRISVGLHIINRSQRYQGLLDQNGAWNLGDQSADASSFKNAFAREIARQLEIECDSWEDLWQIDRLQEMATMLTFDEVQQATPSWLEATRYMRNKAGRPGQQNNINEYQYRPVLPKPREVVDRFQAKIRKNP